MLSPLSPCSCYSLGLELPSSGHVILTRGHLTLSQMSLGLLQLERGCCWHLVVEIRDANNAQESLHNKELSHLKSQ